MNGELKNLVKSDLPPSTAPKVELGFRPPRIVAPKVASFKGGRSHTLVAAVFWDGGHGHSVTGIRKEAPPQFLEPSC
jgi:hypothetical protein